MFVLLGVVRQATALRVIYLDIILYSLGGVIGTMHHLYFSGTPVAHLALGATFSAMEVIPLLLLSLEAWSFIKSGEQKTMERYHLHRWAVWFLVSVGVWNFLGAGVFGFLINLPVVSYYEIGTALTANHGHTAMMGVYGMLYTYESEAGNQEERARYPFRDHPALPAARQGRGCSRIVTRPRQS